MQWVKHVEIALQRPTSSCALGSPVVTVEETAPVLAEQSNNPLSQVTEQRRAWWKHYTEGCHMLLQSYL